MDESTVGLALSGGAARGVAHVGVLRALRDRGYRPDFISGTSAGAMVGALYAAGWSDVYVRRAVRNFSPLQLWRTTVSRPGLYDFRYVRHYWSRYLPQRFEDLQVPLTVVLTDVHRGEPVYVSSGELEPAVLASCALPPLFEAVPIGDRWYFDGGLTANLPAAAIRNRCSILIGCEVNPHIEADPTCHETTWGLFYRSMEVVFRSASAHNRELCDLVIEPEGLNAVHPLDTSRYDEIEEVGYRAGLAAIRDHPEVFSRIPKRPPLTDHAEPAAPPSLHAPAFPGLPLIDRLEAHPGRALALLGGGAALVGLAYYLKRKR